MINKLKQLFPRLYFTKYRTPNGDRHFAIWRMWLGKCYDVMHMPV